MQLEILNNVLCIILISIITVLSSAGLVFFYLLADIQLQYIKLKRLKAQLTKQELSMLTLSGRIIKLMEVVGAYISEIEEKRSALENRRKSYTNLTKRS